MNRPTLALIVQEGSRLITALLQNKDVLFRSTHIEETPSPEAIEEPREILSEKATSIATKGIACIPCSLSHVTACTGELNEAVRFAREDITNPEVTRRVNHCLSEIVACERIDLAPESTASLPPQEKEIADSVAKELRDIRHGLEWYKTKDDLENLAAKTAELQHDTSQKWLNLRLSSMSPELRQTIENKLQQRLTLDQAKKVAAKEAAQEVEKAWNSQEKK